MLLTRWSRKRYLTSLCVTYIGFTLLLYFHFTAWDAEGKDNSFYPKIVINQMKHKRDIRADLINRDSAIYDYKDTNADTNRDNSFGIANISMFLNVMKNSLVKNDIKLNDRWNMSKRIIKAEKADTIVNIAKNQTKYVNQSGDVKTPVRNASIDVLKITAQPNTNPCKLNTSVIFFVISSASNFVQRGAIRNTYGSMRSNSTWPPNLRLNYSVNFVFVVAKVRDKVIQRKVQSEIVRQNDIIEGNFMDSYRNLTLKTLVMLKYASIFCKHVPYIVKVDDDMFMDIPLLLNTLFVKKLLPPRSLMGACLNVPVVREGKWNVPVETFPNNMYPEYLSGTCYVLNSDIVQELLNVSSYVPLIPIEDAYITGVLAKIIDAKHVCLPDLFSYVVEKSPRTCEMINHAKIAYTGISPARLVFHWRKLHLPNKC